MSANLPTAIPSLSTGGHKLTAERQGDLMTINMGPSHPATHGTVKFLLTLDGEMVQDVDIHIGYLHRGFEKMSEQGTWQQVLPYTDRLNYVSPLINNVGYVLAVEKLMGVQCTPRTTWIRMIISEVARIVDHFTALAAGALELGGFAPFLLGLEARETLYPLVEELTGARLTTSYTRIGGLRADLPDDYEKHLMEGIDKALFCLEKMGGLLTKNRIFYDRMIGTGPLSKEDAISSGCTGVMLRSTGVDWDLRKHQPYLAYDQVDFDVIIGHQGDNYDRFLCRIEEIHQSVSIIKQCFKKMPGGPINVDDWHVVLPPKHAVYNTIEGMIAHFKLVIDGHGVPAGEAYQAVEGGNGELGFYVVSQGNGRPFRVHVRAPCFYAMGIVKKMIVGHLLSDIIPTFDALNMIGGEVDR